MFMMTDIVGSTRLWERFGDLMGSVLADHDALVNGVVERHDGVVFKHTGDGTIAVFDLATDAVNAASTLTEEIAALDCGPVRTLQLRISLHAGDALERDGDFFGPPVNCVARLNSVAHPGQILMTGAAHQSLPEGLADGIDLGKHLLADLSEEHRIWQLGAGLHPPLRTPRVGRQNLPRSATELVGRVADIDRLRVMLRERRLVTIVGLGGAGKTRLALEVAGTVSGSFEGGTWFVDLRTMGAGDDVAGACLTGIGVSTATEPNAPPVTPYDALVDFFRGTGSLLILDNCEHVVAPVADFVHRIQALLPGLTVLATSREPLELPAERVFRIPPMGRDGVALFIERVGAIGLDLAETSWAVADVERICERLDGLPLAIELAAAKASIMSPSELLTRLDDRFKLLVSRRAEEPTLQAMMDSSFDLLMPDERQLLRELSVFSGSFNVGAVEAVVSARSEAVPLLEALVAKSLVSANRGPTTRFRLLETVKLYAGGLLDAAGETPGVQARHTAWVHALCDDGDDWTTGARTVARINELDEIVGCLRRLEEHGDLHTEPAIGSLAMAEVWVDAGRLHEGLPWFRAIANAHGRAGNTRAQISALSGMANVAWFSGPVAFCEEICDEALDILAQQPSEAWSTRTIDRLAAASLHLFKGLCCRVTNRGEQAHRHAMRSLEIDTGPDAFVGPMAMALDSMLNFDPDAAASYATRSIEAAGTDPTSALYASRWVAAVVAMSEGRGADAVNHTKAAVQLLAGCPNSPRLGAAMSAHAFALALDDQPQAVVAALETNLGPLGENRQASWEASQCVALALNSLGQQDLNTAVALLDAIPTGSFQTGFHYTVAKQIADQRCQAAGRPIGTTPPLDPADRRALIELTIANQRQASAADL